jgi:hypothetical protein
MRRVVTSLALAAGLLVTTTTAARAEILIGTTIDPGTFVLNADGTVTVTGVVSCSTDRSDVEVVVEALLWQPSERKSRIIGGTGFEGEPCSTTPFEFTLEGGPHPFHPGRAEFRLVAFACVRTTSASCSTTGEVADTGVIIVRIVK